MNKKFVLPMLLHNTALSVHAKLLNLEDLSLQLGNQNDDPNIIFINLMI